MSENIKELKNTIWKIDWGYDDSELQVTFLEDGYFEYFSGDKKIGGLESKWTWNLDGKSITLSFNGGFLILSGEIDSNFDSMQGTFESKFGKKGEWSGIYEKELELDLKKQETGNEISVQDIIDALWEKFQPESPNSLLHQEYETEAKHFEVDYMLNETTVGSDGVERLGPVPDCDGYCYEVVTGNIDEINDVAKDIEKMEKIKVSVWYYIIDNYESDFSNYINSAGLSLGLQSKDDIESEINKMIKSLCDLFSGFTIMGAEDLYPEKGDNPWENPETIYLQVSAEEIYLEDLNPDWTDEEFNLIQ